MALYMTGFRYFFYIFIFPTLIISLYFLISSYDEGDQRVYRAMYDVFADTNWKDVLKVSVSNVTGYEILSPYILWLGSVLGVDKDIYITFLNLILLFLICRWLFSKGVNKCVILLVVTNFYLLVLFTSAERLKISYIFLILCVIQKNQRLMFFFAFLAIMSHMQSIILLVGIAIYFYTKEYGSSLIRFKLNKNFLIILSFLIALSFVVVFILGDALLKKGSGYSSRVSERDITIFLQALILYFSAYLLFWKNNAFNLMTTYFLICIFALGAGRVNMIYFTAVFFVLLSEDKLNKLKLNTIPFLLILLFLSYKSIGYINNIIDYGNGFHS